jgi:hypothetical protein
MAATETNDAIGDMLSCRVVEERVEDGVFWVPIVRCRGAELFLPPTSSEEAATAAAASALCLASSVVTARARVRAQACGPEGAARTVKAVADALGFEHSWSGGASVDDNELSAVTNALRLGGMPVARAWAGDGAVAVHARGDNWLGVLGVGSDAARASKRPREAMDFGLSDESTAQRRRSVSPVTQQRVLDMATMSHASNTVLSCTLGSLMLDAGHLTSSMELTPSQMVELGKLVAATVAPDGSKEAESRKIAPRLAEMCRSCMITISRKPRGGAGPGVVHGASRSISHGDSPFLVEFSVPTEYATAAPGSGGRLSSSATRVLRSWCAAHWSVPFPDASARTKLAADTNTTVRQIENWFARERKRVWKPLKVMAGAAARRWLLRAFVEDSAHIPAVEQFDSDVVGLSMDAGEFQSLVSHSLERYRSSHTFAGDDASQFEGQEIEAAAAAAAAAAVAAVTGTADPPSTSSQLVLNASHLTPSSLVATLVENNSSSSSSSSSSSVSALPGLDLSAILDPAALATSAGWMTSTVGLLPPTSSADSTPRKRS